MEFSDAQLAMIDRRVRKVLRDVRRSEQHTGHVDQLEPLRVTLASGDPAYITSRAAGLQLTSGDPVALTKTASGYHVAGRRLSDDDVGAVEDHEHADLADPFLAYGRFYASTDQNFTHETVTKVNLDTISGTSHVGALASNEVTLAESGIYWIAAGLPWETTHTNGNTANTGYRRMQIAVNGTTEAADTKSAAADGGAVKAIHSHVGILLGRTAGDVVSLHGLQNKAGTASGLHNQVGGYGSLTSTWLAIVRLTPQTPPA